MSLCTQRAIHRLPLGTVPNSHSYGLHVRTIKAAKGIFNLAQLRPTGASPDSLDYSVQVHLETCSIMASKARTIMVFHMHIFKLARSQPPSLSPHSFDHGLQVYFQTCSITASKFARSCPPGACPHSLEHDPGVHIQVHPIMAPNCISKCVRLPPPSASPTWNNHGVGVHPSIHSILIFGLTSNSVSSTTRSQSRYTV